MLVLLLAAAVALWVAVIVVVPAASAARFVAQVSEIRDDCDDAVRYGNLPDIEPVRQFIAKADVMVKDPYRVGGTSRAVAVLVTMANHGIDPAKDLQPPYAELDPEQCEIMATFDRRLIGALSLHLAGGSIFWWILRPLQMLGGSWGAKRVEQSRFNADTAARGYSRALDEHPSLTHAA